MRRSAAFEPVRPQIGGAAVTTVYTALASNVRTELERCHGPSERTRRALEFLMTYSGAARGFLYVYRSGRLEFVAAIPEGEPTTILEQRLNQWVSLSFESENLTTTASFPDGLEPILAPSFTFVELVTIGQGESLLAGVAALEPSGTPLSRIPSDILRAVGEELLRTGDASGKPLFARSAG
jgi:hypothetical protein